MAGNKGLWGGKGQSGKYRRGKGHVHIRVSLTGACFQTDDCVKTMAIEKKKSMPQSVVLLMKNLIKVLLSHSTLRFSLVETSCPLHHQPSSACLLAQDRPLSWECALWAICSQEYSSIVCSWEIVRPNASRSSWWDRREEILLPCTWS